MKVSVDRDKCTALGICESLAPSHFEVDEDGELVLLKEEVSEGELALIRQAVAGCPTSALSLEAG